MKHTTFEAEEFESAMMQDNPNPMPVSVQILSTLLYGAFAIVSVIIALNMFWPAGVVLAAILGWRGGFVPQNFTQVSTRDIAEKVRNLSPEATQRSSGNASFDAYRRDIMQRLEDEQDSFDNFLGRLRDAKDQSEFDRFLDDRARNARSINPDDA